MMDEEQKARKEPKAVEAPKPWAPRLTLKKDISPTTSVGVSRETETKRESDGSVSNLTKPAGHRTIGYDELRKFPCKCARKYELWSRYDYSEQDRQRLMAMTIQEIAQAERSGIWPQPQK